MRFPLLSLFAAAFAFGSLAGAAPAPAPKADRKTPETRAGGYRFVVERVQQTQNVNIEFGEGTDGKVSGRQSVTISLAVHPPARELIANIDGLAQRMVASGSDGTDAQPVVLNGYTSDEGNPLTTGVWRASLIAQDLDLSVTRLSKLQGELVVYPSAKRVAIDLPLAAKLPVTREAEGVKCTLKQLKSRADTLTVSVEIETPPLVTVSRVNADSQDPFAAVTKAGSLVFPRREALLPSRRDGRNIREYTLTFTEVKDAPVSIRMEAMVRSGAPKHLAFTLPELVLPDMLGIESELEKAEGTTGPLTEDHPLYARSGGTIVIPVRGARSSVEARLLVGLSRKDGEAYGPWRWLEATLDRDGHGTLANVRPGHYRIAVRWSTGAASATPDNAPMRGEVDVAAGKPVRLPPFEAGARP